MTTTTKTSKSFSHLHLPTLLILLLLLLCLSLSICLYISSVVAAVGEQEATATGKSNQVTTTTTTSELEQDLDNSIRQADVHQPTTGNQKQQQDKRRQLEKNKETATTGSGEGSVSVSVSASDDKRSTTEQQESNDLAEPSGDRSQEQQQPNNFHHHHHQHHQQQQQEATTKLLSRRLDLLEFELRKTLLLLHHQTRIKTSNNDDDFQPTTDKQTSQLSADSQKQQQRQHHSNSDQTTNQTGKSQLHLEALAADLSSRLELMENFITVTTKKLYETEQRVKQLEKCDCRLKCKWFEPADALAGSSQQQQQQQSPLIKMDGQNWRHKCDVCSCHRGQVSCRHVNCPKADCPEPSYAPGRCCPVCHKNCSFNGQTVKHGHKLVINSKQDTCKECLCSDGRLKCHRVEQFDWNGGGSGGKPPPPAPLAGSNNDVSGSPGQIKTTTTPIATSTLSTSDDYRLANRTQRIQRSTPIDLGLDFHLAAAPSLSLQHSTWGLAGLAQIGNDHDDETGDERPRHDYRIDKDRRARSNPESQQPEINSMPLHGSQLVCPQIEDCKLENQIRLKNDCCTYCRSFDFCSLYGRFHCHPNAVCLNNNNSLVSQEEIERKSLTLGSMFDCRCGPGFAGNGLLCRDIDECADRKLNDCDPKSSICVNSSGGYHCKCRPGFKEAPQSEDSDSPADSSSSSSSNSNNNNQQQQQQIRLVTQMELVANLSSSRVRLKSCRDINECNDGKLNRCHQQAKCINLSGSYKCHCNRGYLGNGFECHQWFSSQPSVAAYLHRHSSSQVNASNNETSFTSRGAISVPLDSLFDPDEDRSDLARDELYSLEFKYDEDDHSSGNFEEEADNDDMKQNIQEDLPQLQRGEKAPDLANSKWEPLKFAEQTNVFQQTDGLVSASQRVSSHHHHNHLADDNLNPISELHHHQVAAAAPTTTTTTSEPPRVSSSSLNTRTMFFQPPPPKSRRPQQTATSLISSTDPSTTTTTTTTATTATTTSSNDKHASDTAAAAAAKSQTMATIRESLLHDQQQQQQPPIGEQTKSLELTRDSSSHPPQSSAVHQLRRGSIIASATTSPIRGYHPNQYHVTHQSRNLHNQQQQQQHKALKVSSSPTSAAASSLYHPSAINSLLARDLNLFKAIKPMVGLRQLSFEAANLLLFTMIATILQIYHLVRLEHYLI